MQSQIQDLHEQLEKKQAEKNTQKRIENEIKKRLDKAESELVANKKNEEKLLKEKEAIGKQLRTTSEQ